MLQPHDLSVKQAIGFGAHTVTEISEFAGGTYDQETVRKSIDALLSAGEIVEDGVGSAAPLYNLHTNLS